MKERAPQFKEAGNERCVYIMRVKTVIRLCIKSVGLAVSRATN
jgi:hypothetical protein